MPATLSSSPPLIDLGVERLQPTNYSRSRDRVQSGLMEVQEAETKAQGLTARLTVDARGVSQVQERKKGGAVRSAARSLTEAEVWTIEAQQRFGRGEQQLHRLLAWTEDQVAREDKRTDTLRVNISSNHRPATAAPVQLRAAPPRKDEESDEEVAAPQVTVVVDEEVSLHQERPIALSPPSTLSSPFRLLYQQHLVFPSHPSASSTPSQAQSARVSTSSPTSQRGSRPATPLTSRSARRPATAAVPMRASLLHAQLRTDAVMRQSVRSLMSAATNDGVGWQVRLTALEEAEALDGEREQAEGRRQRAEAGEVDVREAVAEAMRGAERVRTAKVAMRGLGAVCEPKGMGGDRGQRPARPHSSASIRRHAQRWAHALDGSEGSR